VRNWIAWSLSKTPTPHPGRRSSIDMTAAEGGLHGMCNDRVARPMQHVDGARHNGTP